MFEMLTRVDAVQGALEVTNWLQARLFGLAMFGVLVWIIYMLIIEARGGRNAYEMRPRSNRYR